MGTADDRPYTDPAAFGLEFLGEIEWSGFTYEFDMTAVWYRSGALVPQFFWADDSGCSCPTPFENTSYEELRSGGLGDLQRHLEARAAGVEPCAPVSSDTARMRMADMMARAARVGMD